jgi:hypothetical protein
VPPVTSMSRASTTETSLSFAFSRLITVRTVS